MNAYFPLTRRQALGLGAATAVGTMLPLQRARAQGTMIRVSEVYGHPDDATAAIQSALDSGAETVVIDHDGTVGEEVQWNVGPLHVNRDDLVVILEPGVRLQGLPGAFPGNNDCLLSIADRRRVSILGYGAILAMNRAEYTTGEWRMGITVLGSRSVLLEGFSVIETGGDGIYLGVSKTRPAAEQHCGDITIRNVECSQALRNALSVISVDGLTVENCAFNRSYGKSPQGGVDLEPNHPTNLLRRIRFRDCQINNNGTYGLIVSLANLDSSSRPVDITFDKISLGNTGSQIPNFVFYGPRGGSDPGGRVTVRNSLIAKNPIMGAIGVYEKTADGIAVDFHKCVIWDYGNEFRRWQPITISPIRPSNSETTLDRDYGGVRLGECHLITTAAGPLVTTDREGTSGPRMSDVHGRLMVTHANDSGQITADFGRDPRRCTLKLLPIDGSEDSMITLHADGSQVAAGQSVRLRVRREGGDLRAPLAVAYSVSKGSARTGLHFDRQTGSIIIPAGEQETVLKVGTRRDIDSAVALGAQLVGGRGYRTVVGQRQATVKIVPR